MTLIEKAKARIPGLDLDKLLERTIISIETDIDENHTKYVHFLGYGYCAEDSVTDDPEEIYRFVYYTYFYVPLAEVLERGFGNVEGDDSCECKQYIDDCTEESCLKTYLEYNAGHTPLPIYLDELTMDIPEGCYVVLKGGDV